MEQLITLPVREAPLAGESLSSLVRRTAQAMGYESVGRLTALVGEERFCPSRLDQLDHGVLLEALAGLLGHDAGALRNLTVHPWASSLVLGSTGQPAATSCDPKTVLRFFRLAAPSVCATCASETPTYRRLIWSFRPLAVCLHHRCWLTAPSSLSKSVRAVKEQDAEQIASEAEVAQVSVADEVVRLSQSIERWLQGTAPLANFSAAGAWHWLERLAVAVKRTPHWLMRSREHWAVPSQITNEQLAWLAAANLVVDWPGRLIEFLEAYQEIDKPTALATGTGRAFGRLLREAARLEQLGFSPPAEVLRTYVLERFTRGHLTTKVCLFRSPRHRSQIAARPWLTQTQAARILNVRPAAIGSLLARGVLQGKLLPAGRRSVGLVSQQSVLEFQQQLAETVSLVEASRRLGIERHRLVELIEAGILPGCHRNRLGWRIPAGSLERLLGLTEQLPAPDGVGWITVRHATRAYGRRGLTLAVLVELAVSGKVRLARKSNAAGLENLWVDRRELIEELGAIAHQRDLRLGYPLNRVVSMLMDHPIKETVLRKWIAAGLLSATRSAGRWYIQPSAIEQFRQTYCLAAEICQALEISRAKLRQMERRGEIEAVYSRRRYAGAGASVFRRADLERLQAVRPQAA